MQLSEKMNECTEMELQSQILAYLRIRGILCWRPNQNYRSGRYVARESIGTFDIVGVMKGGRFLGIEVKKPKGKVSDKQKVWMDEVNKLGGKAFVAHSVEEVVNEL